MCISQLFLFLARNSARDTCLSENAILAKISSANQNAEVLSLASQTTSFEDYLFIGGRDANVEGTWYVSF